MSRASSLPRLFVGSSTEGLEVAYAIQENLEYYAETTVWPQGVFNPSTSILSELLDSLSRFDFAAFVFSPDDTMRIRQKVYSSVRDNVLFELGLFFGGLGKDRCFYLMPRDEQSLRLPTDLLGVNPLTYLSHRSDGNLVAALGTACNQMRRAFRKGEGQSSYKTMTLQDYIDAWNSPELRQSLENIRAVVLDHYSEEFAAQRADLRRVFAFLDGLSEAVLDEVLDEKKVRDVFERAVISIWPIAATMLAPPNHVDDYWRPLPSLALLYQRWNA